MRRPVFLAGALALALLTGAGSTALADGITATPSTEGLSDMLRWGGMLTSLLVVLGAWLFLRFVNNLVASLGRQFAPQRLLLQKLGTIIQFFVYIAAGGLIVVLSFRLDDRALAVIGGTLAVAVGFAIKDLVASFIAGIMIMIDRPFQVGDRVKFGGEYGDITAIGLRSVRLQTLDDNTVTIPNNKFLNDMTSCGNYGQLDMQVVMDFFIGVDQDVVRARAIVSEAGLSSRYVFLGKPAVVLVNQLMEGSYVAIRLRLKAYVLDTQFEKVFETDVHLRVLDGFRHAGIAPPAILHRTLPTEPARLAAPSPSPSGIV
ncbi:MAG: mechanosensitive ion channel domain-containing protein [Kofleriaceae bacterium]